MNKEEYTEFYNNYKNYVTNFLKKKSRGSDIVSNQDVDDLVSTIFMKIYKKVCVDKSVDMKDHKRYVTVVARNTYIDHIRSLKAAKNIRSKMTSLDGLLIPYSIPSVVDNSRVHKEEMLKAMEECPCELIKLRLEGKTMDQIGIIKNLSYTTVQSRIERSKKRIRKSYKNSLI